MLSSRGFWLAIVLIGIVAFVFVGEEKEPRDVVEDLDSLAPKHNVIGISVEGRDIDAYTYGDGDTHLMFVGGVHGGYEWNSILLAYRIMDHLEVNQDILPQGMRVTIIPSANPDGVYKVVGKEGRFAVSDIKDSVPKAPGRFNANGVDLNRNFDCKWKPESTWRGDTVSAGTEAFSEPEARAIRDVVLETDPDAVIFWHSKANTVYASECTRGVLPETIDIMNAYSQAADYNAVEIFDAYEITGDAEGWLASINIPAITVELKTHETIEFAQNLRGVESLFEYYQ